MKNKKTIISLMSLLAMIFMTITYGAEQSGFLTAVNSLNDIGDDVVTVGDSDVFELRNQDMQFLKKEYPTLFKKEFIEIEKLLPKLDFKKCRKEWLEFFFLKFYIIDLKHKSITAKFDFNIVDDYTYDSGKKNRNLNAIFLQANNDNRDDIYFILKLEDIYNHLYNYISKKDSDEKDKIIFTFICENFMDFYNFLYKSKNYYEINIRKRSVNDFSLSFINELNKINVSIMNGLYGYALSFLQTKELPLVQANIHMESFVDKKSVVGEVFTFLINYTNAIIDYCAFPGKDRHYTRNFFDNHQGIMSEVYKKIYEFLKLKKLIPKVIFANGDVFEFPQEVNQPLIDVKKRESEEKKAQEALVRKQKEEQEAAEKDLLESLGFEEEVSHKKSKKLKKSKDKVPQASCSSSNQEEPALVSAKNSSFKSSKPIDEPMAGKDNHPELCTAVSYANRVQDWFVDPERALKLQGYVDGASGVLFKKELLRKFEKEAIIFNHKFPKVIDLFLLMNEKIKKQKKEDGSFDIKVSGYYNENNIRKFGQFELSFNERKESSKKESKINRTVFHRFFRPVENFSDLLDLNKLNIQKDAHAFYKNEDDLERIEVEAAVSDDQGWTTNAEQEGWQVNLAKEDDGYITVSHPGYPVSYALFLN